MAPKDLERTGGRDDLLRGVQGAALPIGREQPVDPFAGPGPASSRHERAEARQALLQLLRDLLLGEGVAAGRDVTQDGLECGRAPDVRPVEGRRSGGQGRPIGASGASGKRRTSRSDVVLLRIGLRPAAGCSSLRGFKYGPNKKWGGPEGPPHDTGGRNEARPPPSRTRTSPQTPGPGPRSPCSGSGRTAPGS